MGRAAGGCEPAHHKTYDTAQQLDKFLERLERPYLESESRLPVFTELSRGRPSRKPSVRVDIYSDTRPPPERGYEHRLCTVACATNYFSAGASLYDLEMSDPTHLAQNLTEYFSAVMCLVLTFHCWRLDRQGRANATTKASYPPKLPTSPWLVCSS